MSRPVSRRRLLIAAGAGVAAAAVGVLTRAFEPGSHEVATPEELLAALDDRGDARLIGARCLEVRTDPTTPAELTDALSSRLHRHGWRPGAGTDRLRSAVAASIRADFAKGDMVGIDGWQLARTSTELCTLAALT